MAGTLSGYVTCHNWYVQNYQMVASGYITGMVAQPMQDLQHYNISYMHGGHE